MKKLMIIACVMVSVGCVTDEKTGANLNMTNPASSYCIAQGGQSEIVGTPQGEVGYCLLPSGERVEEWSLYRKAVGK